MTPEGIVAKACREIMDIYDLDWCKAHVITGRMHGRYINSGKVGRADDNFLIEDGSGRTCYVEYKKPGGTQSPEQIDFMNKCDVLNIPYILADSVDSFRAGLIYYEIINNV